MIPVDEESGVAPLPRGGDGSEEEEVQAFAPGSVGNVACGFDIFGVAMQRPGDRVVARRSREPGVRIVKVTGVDGGSDRIPSETERNSAGAAARALVDHLGVRTGIELEVHKGLPVASGLGGSGASAVAAVVAVDGLLRSNLSKSVLFECALEGERVCSGAAPTDNVAPSLFGGFILVRPGSSPDIIELPVPEGMALAVVHPHLEIETRAARLLLGDTVPLAKAIVQWGNTAALVAGLFRSDWDLISRALVDEVAEPLRAHLIPGFANVKAAGLTAGALGCSLSGSGPSVFALCRTIRDALAAGDAMREAFGDVSIPSDLFASEIDRTGARVLTEKGPKTSEPTAETV
jgi:homoserine kinase